MIVEVQHKCDQCHGSARAPSVGVPEGWVWMSISHGSLRMTNGARLLVTAEGAFCSQDCAAAAVAKAMKEAQK